MKRLLIITFLCIGLFPIVNAQQADKNKQATQEDYERIYEKELEMNFRSFVIKSLELNEDEIKGFDPLFREYMQKKSKLMDKKMKLLKEHTEEMAENDSKADEEEETADFIEEYWEVEIDEMELRKDYFDKMENKITYRKAANFFVLEDVVDSRVHRNYLIKSFPVIVEIEGISDNSDKKKSNKTYGDQTKAEKSADKMTEKGADAKTKEMKEKKDYQGVNKTKDKAAKKHDKSKADVNKDTKAGIDVDQPKTYNEAMANADELKEKGVNTADHAHYRKNISDFDTWVVKSKGKVGLDHKYTHDGLTKLANAIYSISDASGVKINDIENKKKQIVQMADDLRKDPMSDEHADIAREAFIMIADLLHNLQTNNKFVNAKGAVQEVSDAARKLDADTLLTQQDQAIYAFFEKAQKAVNQMSDSVAWTDKAKAKTNK